MADPTLVQLLQLLFELSTQGDQLRARVQELERAAEQHSQADERTELAALWTAGEAKG